MALPAIRNNPQSILEELVAEDDILKFERRGESHPRRNVRRWKTRRLVYTRARGRCEYCGRHHPFVRGWTVDHIYPRWLGGDHGGVLRLNLAMACVSCNIDKAGHLLGEWKPPVGLRLFWALRAVRVARYYRYGGVNL